MHRLLARRRNRLFLAALATMPVALGLVAGALLHSTSRYVERSRAAVQSTRQAIAATEKVRSLALDVETGTRGYLLTGDDDFLRPFKSGVAELPVAFEMLESAARGGSEAHALAGRVVETAKAQLELQGAAVACARVQPFALDDRMVVASEGKRLMDELRRVSGEFTAHAESRLARERAALDQALSYSRTVTAALVVTTIVLCVFVALLLWQAERHRAFATMCAWSRTIEYEGEWLTFEEYLDRRFGIKTSHGINPAERVKLERQAEQSRRAAEAARQAELQPRDE